MILAFLFALTVLAPLVGFGPPMKRGDHASNSILSVVAPHDHVPHALGIEAQETVEWWLAWVAGCVVALPVVLLVPGMVGEAAALVAAFFGNALARKATGHFDLAGHNVEIIVEERQGFTDYRTGEIERMIGPRGEQRGMTFDQADAALRRWEPVAHVALALFRRRFA